MTINGPAQDASGLSSWHRSRLDAALTPDEQVLWVGTPDAGDFFRRHLWHAVAGVVWLGVAGYVMLPLPRFSGWSAGGVIAWLLVASFLLPGVSMLSLPLRMARRARTMVYAITTQRALILGAGSATSVHAFMVGQIRTWLRVDRRGGLGDLMLEEASADETQHRPEQIRGFLSLADVRGCETVLMRVVGSPASAGDGLPALGVAS